ncbi:hypothetical protein ACE4Z6_27425, partial [Salmonella enterica]|uniref:hypothetical protein n=1 Tax=Salmonella enterica TaxID=28901 RepID=UPI003D2DF332
NGRFRLHGDLGWADAILPTIEIQHWLALSSLIGAGSKILKGVKKLWSRHRFESEGLAASTKCAHKNPLNKIKTIFNMELLFIPCRPT